MVVVVVVVVIVVEKVEISRRVKIVPDFVKMFLFINQFIES